MKRFFTILIFWLLAISSFAQKSDYAWLLGYKPINPDPDSLLGINLVDFSSGI